MKTHYPVIIVGGGQAGLAMSYCLKSRQIEHVVFEKNRIGESWRTQRWDTFCLVTPNWQCDLPGFRYQGNDPQGFMVKDQIVDFIEAYAASFEPPVKEGIAVKSVLKNPATSLFEIETSEGYYTADQIVIAVGNFHSAALPEMAARFSPDVVHVHSSTYKNPESLPDKEILVVGTGQSGCQIAEDLHLAGKKVHLCVGNAPRTARRYRGKDVVEWLHEMNYYDLPIDQHPDGAAVRDKTNHYVTGRDGGREIDLRHFALEGMRLYGPLKNVEGSSLEFAPELKKNLDSADKSSENIKKKIDQYIAKNGVQAPVEAPYEPVWEPTEEVGRLDYRAANIGTVIWCIGFGVDFSWVKLPVFDARGLPRHQRGVTEAEGLYFLGLTWQYTWGSARFSGVGKDAEFLAEKVVESFAAKEAMEKSRA